MVSGEAEPQLDETVCNVLACQHPPCWEALRRTESGRPRRTVPGALGSPGRESPDDEGELPSLKVVNLPLDCSRREKVKRAESYGSVSKTISSMKGTRSYFSNSTQNDTLLPPVSVLSSERDPFPGLNSRMDSHSLRCSPISFTCWRQAEKVQVTDITEFAMRRLGSQPPYGNLVVRWIPSAQSRLLQPEKPAATTVMPPRRICVKELSLESILSPEENPEPKRKKSSKVPTGGQPYLLHLRRNKQVPADQSSLRVTPLASSQEESGPKMESGRGALSVSREKGAPPLFIVQNAPSLYRFEPKIPARDECSRRIHRQLKVPSGGSVPRWHPVPGLVEQLDSADASGHRRAGGRGRGGRDWLSQTTQLLQEAPTEESAPPVLPVAHPERKPLVKFVEGKNVTAQLLTVDCRNFVPRISRTESKFNQYCKQLASRKEPPPPPRDPPPATPSGRQSMDTPRGTSRESLPPLLSPNPHPPPPPPSPFLSESSEDASLD